MLPDLLNSPVSFIFWLLALVVAITFHEFAHAFVADRLGDPTPRLMGRLTLNPLAHLDPIGTLMILIVRFGWGKPVQFDPFNLRNPRRDGALISLAGPTTNILLAIVFSFIYQLILGSAQMFTNLPVAIPFLLIIGFLRSVIIINVILGIFNLVPVHPLDGFKIVEGLLPEEYARQWHELAGYGMIFLILLIVPLFGRTSPINNLISPVINFILNLLLPTGGII